MARHNAYLPDDLSDLVKQADPPLKISRMLRAAVLAEFERRENITRQLDNDYMNQYIGTSDG